jgi:periplasmic protein CpxP/Spy
MGLEHMSRPRTGEKGSGPVWKFPSVVIERKLEMKIRIHKWSGVMAAALLAMAAQGALAQPGGGPGQGPGHGPGGGFAIENVLASLKGQLGLEPSQQAKWDAVVAQSKAARETGRANMEKVREALNAELAGATPDFAAVATIADAAQASNQTLRRQVRDQWLALYATFTPAQKAVVRDAVKARVGRMESMREKFRERMQSRSPGAGS